MGRDAAAVSAAAGMERAQINEKIPLSGYLDSGIFLMRENKKPGSFEPGFLVREAGVEGSAWSLTCQVEQLSSGFG